jgi:hypothetical protein
LLDRLWVLSLSPRLVRLLGVLVSTLCGLEGEYGSDRARFWGSRQKRQISRRRQSFGSLFDRLRRCGLVGMLDIVGSKPSRLRFPIGLLPWRQLLVEGFGFG